MQSASRPFSVLASSASVQFWAASLLLLLLPLWLLPLRPVAAARLLPAPPRWARQPSDERVLFFLLALAQVPELLALLAPEPVPPSCPLPLAPMRRRPLLSVLL